MFCASFRSPQATTFNATCSPTHPPGSFCFGRRFCCICQQIFPSEDLCPQLLDHSNCTSCARLISLCAMNSEIFCQWWVGWGRKFSGPKPKAFGPMLQAHPSTHSWHFLVVLCFFQKPSVKIINFLDHFCGETHEVLGEHHGYLVASPCGSQWHAEALLVDGSRQTIGLGIWGVNHRQTSRRAKLPQLHIWKNGSVLS